MVEFKNFKLTIALSQSLCQGVKQKILPTNWQDFMLLRLIVSDKMSYWQKRVSKEAGFPNRKSQTKLPKYRESKERGLKFIKYLSDLTLEEKRPNPLLMLVKLGLSWTIPVEGFVTFKYVAKLSSPA